VSERASVQHFPRGVLIAAGLMLTFAILAAGAGRLTGAGLLQQPTAAPVEVRELRFEDGADGSVAVLDAASGALVATLAPGTNGFIRGVLRGLARDRRLADIGMAAPFVLTLWQDGRLSLADPATGRFIDLGAFGTTSLDAFARLVDAAVVVR
jgi:putative photosynthetic complex assembly protein